MYTLTAWRKRRKGSYTRSERGPDYVKLGRLVRYRLEDVREWVERHRVKAR